MGQLICFFSCFIQSIINYRRNDIYNFCNPVLQLYLYSGYNESFKLWVLISTILLTYLLVPGGRCCLSHVPVRKLPKLHSEWVCQNVVLIFSIGHSNQIGTTLAKNCKDHSDFLGHGHIVSTVLCNPDQVLLIFLVTNMSIIEQCSQLSSLSMLFQSMCCQCDVCNW